MSGDVSLDQVFERMPALFQPEKAGNTNATYQFNLSGAGGGEWWVKIADGAATTGQGRADSPDVTMAAEAGDYARIAQGKLDGAVAFMQGKLKISGDMGLATKLQSMFRRPE